MKKLFIISAFVSVVFACNNPDDSLVESSMKPAATEKVQTELPELSIYNLPSTWTTQDSEEIELKELRGNVVVMVMIYTSCKAACPRLVADIRNIESKFQKSDLENVKFVLVSIDPDVDTPERLNKFAIDNEMAEDHWMFLRGTKEATREFATVLAVSYKKISPMDFSHSNIISVFNEEGLLVHQKEGLGVDNQETVNEILREIHN